MNTDEKAMLNVITDCIENFKQRGKTNKKELDIIDDALEILFEEFEEREKEKAQMNGHERRMINSIIHSAGQFKEHQDEKKACLDCISLALKELYEELGEEPAEICEELSPDLEIEKNNRMTDKVKIELEKMITVINNDLKFVSDGIFLKEESIKLQFSAIRHLVDYCEALVLIGEEAIE